MIKVAKDYINKILQGKEVKGRDKSCAYYPCHPNIEDCSWCFCPFYPCHFLQTGGRTIISQHDGKPVWNCGKCTWIHSFKTSQLIFEKLNKSGKKIEEFSREDLLRIFQEAIKQMGLKTVRTLMVQGTSSHSGKSILVTALCRILNDLELKVAPFKAQNMSLNSFVTKDGGEISRSQTLQAYAARIEPTTDMNPILIKPKGDKTSQVILRGKPYGDMTVQEYYSSFVQNEGIRAIESSMNNLLLNFDVILIEGAGSPSEINLGEVEVANMRIAEMADAPVIIIADIDRGGVFAQIAGTTQLLKPEHKMRVKGFVINKFRGDPDILKPGIEKIKEITGIPILGVLPYLEDLSLPNEDSLALEDYFQSITGVPQVAVVRLPKISNFTDIDPLTAERALSVHYVKRREDLKNPDAIIIPGTKNTIQDLVWLKESGLSKEIIRLSQMSIPVIGICGGFQILGRTIVDPTGLENDMEGKFDGLNLLDITTRFEEYKKVTKQVTAKIISKSPILNNVHGETIQGYEIHMGKSTLGKECNPIFKIDGEKPGKERYEGAESKSGLVLGTYIHGVFDDPHFRKGLIDYLYQRKGFEKKPSSQSDIKKVWEESLRRFVKAVKENLNMEAIFRTLEIS